MTQRYCPSRRNALRLGLAGLAAGVAGVSQRVSAQTAKLPKTAVMYQDHPNGGHQCSQCVHFQPPSSCQIVQGDIAPNGWCGAWAPKQT